MDNGDSHHLTGDVTGFDRGVAAVWRTGSFRSVLGDRGLAPAGDGGAGGVGRIVATSPRMVSPRTFGIQPMDSGDDCQYCFGSA